MSTVVIVQSLPRYCAVCVGREWLQLVQVNGRASGLNIPCPHCTDPTLLHVLVGDTPRGNQQ